MKLATFKEKNQEKIGIVLDGCKTILDIKKADYLLNKTENNCYNTMLDLIDNWDLVKINIDVILENPPENAISYISNIKLLPPIPIPRKIRDCIAFEEHLLNCKKLFEQKGYSYAIPKVWYQQPIYYKGNCYSAIGHGQDVICPNYSSVLDYELELGCIIGKKGINVNKKDGLLYVFGYTIFNDASARDMQAIEMPGQLGPAKSKDFDTGNILGPWIVTSDEIPDPQNLKMTVKVNGELRGMGNSKDMHFTFSDIISFLSKSETLIPGEIIGSGTVGTGSGFEQGKFIKSGDIVELEIEKIGVLKNRFII
jgi:2-keto-4-pentenoate hydratase/2-oxohepta-3-ene-1,7-dioic acid hydratase in catechol pathway